MLKAINSPWEYLVMDGIKYRYNNKINMYQILPYKVFIKEELTIELLDDCRLGLDFYADNNITVSTECLTQMIEDGLLDP